MVAGSLKPLGQRRVGGRALVMGLEKGRRGSDEEGLDSLGFVGGEEGSKEKRWVSSQVSSNVYGSGSSLGPGRA